MSSASCEHRWVPLRLLSRQQNCPYYSGSTAGCVVLQCEAQRGIIDRYVGLCPARVLTAARDEVDDGHEHGGEGGACDAK